MNFRTSDDDIRADQAQYGRSQEGKSTLHVKPGYDIRRSGNNGGNRRPQQKFVPKGHEAFLKALEGSGATVRFEKVSSGETVEGIIKHSDKYTISVETCIVTGPTAGQTETRVLFKHDISEFSALTPPKKAEEDLQPIAAE